MCSICRKEPCDYRCPNYEPPKTIYHCSSCGEGIYEGEKYLENINGDYRHHDCFFSTDDLLEWLEIDVKTMEKEYE